MRHYICKEDLLNRLEKEVGISERFSTTFVKDISTIKNMPSVTKADICWDFVESLEERYGGEIFSSEGILRFIAEMEDEG